MKIVKMWEDFNPALKGRWIIITCIIILSLLLRFIRDWKEDSQNYSDPMLNSLLYIFCIYCVVLVLDYTLEIIGIYFLNGYFEKLTIDWIMRDYTKLFNINNFVKLGKLIIFVFPYRGLKCLLTFLQVITIWKLIRIGNKYRYYFF